MHNHNIIFRSTKKVIYKRTLIINAPVIGLNNPPMGPAIIQAVAKQNGVDTSFIDLNLDLQRALENHKLKHGILHEWSSRLRLDLTEEEEEFLTNFIDSYSHQFNDYDLLSISVFSYHSQNFVKWLLTNYRKNYSGKIIVGGAGVGTSFEDCPQYGKKLLDLGLVDYFIVGEGEQAWAAVAQNNLPWPGVNGTPHENLDTFDAVPLPDYNGFDLDAYYNSQSNGRTIGIEGSRGCVRNCTFCDIRSFWKKYKFKDGDKLAEELIELKTRYQVKHFFFNDSLINGSDKAFRNFIRVLAEYNRNTEDKIKWSAYYIVKPAVVYKEQDWLNLRDSGVQSLFIGIESGSEAVRDHMGKKFSNDDIDHVMHKLQRYGVQCTWLLIIGYPSETREDFDMTLNMLRKYQSMALDRTINTVALGSTLTILEGSPLADMKDELNIQSVIQDHYGGVYWETDANNFRLRLAWRIEAEKLIRELGYNSWVGENDMIAWFEARLDDIEKGQVSQTDLADHHA
jgi:radical SAM superfamily enzyme YgiQ (UPF0313 family)